MMTARAFLMVLLLALGGWCCELAASDSDAPLCITPAAAEFLLLREYVIRDAISQVPESLRARSVIPLRDYLGALGAARAPLDLGGDSLEGVLLPAHDHWLLVVAYHSYVKRSAIGVIDDRPGVLQYLPPTPAIPGGALAQPEAVGVTVSVGSGRIFCGVRTQARALTITHADVLALAQRVRAPDAAAVMALLCADHPLPR